MTDHILIVPEDPEDGLDVIHPEGCPQYGTNWGGIGYDCDVGYEIECSGITTSFDHIANKHEAMGWYDPEYLEPGEYRIRYAQESHYSWEYGSTEYSTWLERIED